MKRDEAEKLAKQVFVVMTRYTPDGPLPKGLRERIMDAILSAYRKGAEEMRERCAVVAARERRLADVRGTYPASLLEKRIRALPLTEDDQGNQEGEAGRRK